MISFFKKNIKIGVFIATMMFVAYMILLIFDEFNKPKKHADIETYGIIEDIKLEEGSRGNPAFLINGKWQYLGLYGYSLRPLAEVKDSIAKPKGSDVLYLFRKNNSGSYTLFDELKY